MLKNNIQKLVEKITQGDPGAAARALSLVIDESPGFEELTQKLFPYSGSSHKVGFSGPPGSGKSSLIGELIRFYREKNLKVGVLAVDPSSSLSGGSFLGDRLRIQDHSTDPGVFIRSLATRGMVGGVCAAIYGAIRVLEAYGCDKILIETVGTGQDEVVISKVADTVLYVTTPSLGDDIQAMKAGIMEIADIFIVNKADLSETEKALSDIRRALSLAAQTKKGWKPNVLASSVVLKSGIEELANAVEEHRKHLSQTGEGRQRLQCQLSEEISLYATRKVYDKVAQHLSEKDMALLLSKKTDPVALAQKLIKKIR